MSEISNDFTWVRQLGYPQTAFNDSMKKILCKGVLKLLWEDISNSIFPMEEACKIRKNILLYKLKHELNDTTITSIKHLNQLKSKNNALKQQISTLEKEYEGQDHIVRQKMQRIKDIKDKCSMIRTRKDFLKLKHDETSKQLKDCDNMRQVYQHLMPNTSKDINQQKLREYLDTIANLRSAANKKQIWKKISNFLGSIDTYTLWTHLNQSLSLDLDKLIKFETKNDSNNSTVAGEDLDIGIARACGQNICLISKCVLSNAKIKTYQQRLMELIESIESLSSHHENVSTWLALTLEVKKLEAAQAYLQNQVQELKNNAQQNISLNHDIARLTTEIETIDAQMDGYVKDIQQSIAIFNSATSLILKAKEKLHYGLQKIVALQSDDYDRNCLNNALDIELDVFYYNLHLKALRKVMLKGDVGLYRHTICNLNKTSITTINPQCWRIKTYFPMIQMPIYCLIECYRNVIANIFYTKLHCSTSIQNINHGTDRISREKYDHNSLELLNRANIVCDQAREEIEHFDAILKTWTHQEVQEAMALIETTVDNVSFKDWLHRYSILLYMIQNGSK